MIEFKTISELEILKLAYSVLPVSETIVFKIIPGIRESTIHVGSRAPKEIAARIRELESKPQRICPHGRCEKVNKLEVELDNVRARCAAAERDAIQLRCMLDASKESLDRISRVLSAQF